VLGHFKPSFGLYVNYAHRPLVLSIDENSDGKDIRRVGLVQHQLQADALASIALFNQLEIGLALPVMLFQGSEDDPAVATRDVASLGLGDIRLVPKWQFYTSAATPSEQNGGLSAAFMAIVGIPTGDNGTFTGGALAVEPRVAVDWRSGAGHKLGGHLGYAIRGQQDFIDLSVGNELTYGLAYQHPLITDRLAVMAELYGRLPVDGDVDFRAAGSPMELLLSGRLWLAEGHAVSLGAGPGITTGYGTPVVRAFAGYTYSGYTPPDTDGDTIRDPDDKCIHDPEDFDGFEDEDGCPEADNDQDGILDADDQCPIEAGIPEENGCPAQDTDGDGIMNHLDQCKSEAEDFDKFQDEDGCPEADNDQDGLLDADDKCPIDAEDKDGFEDEDGCPDPDNDQDGILDVDDQCPMEQEVYNGVLDEDGCPDKGKAKVIITKERIVIEEKVFFDFDKDTIQERSNPILNQVAGVLITNPQILVVEIQGHTDDQGEEAYNTDLSQRRANSVRAYMLKRGVKSARLVAKGYGESKPLIGIKGLEGKKLEEARENNRRVEFLIVNQQTEIEQEVELGPDGKPLPKKDKKGKKGKKKAPKAPKAP
jgi:large repetitive protein